jgi:hypothetical protein
VISQKCALSFLAHGYLGLNALGSKSKFHAPGTLPHFMSAKVAMAVHEKSFNIGGNSAMCEILLE